MRKNEATKKKLVLLIITFCLFINSKAKQQKKQKEYKNIVVVTPSYNNKKYYKKNLDSFFYQDYPNAKMIYIDDASPDETGDLVEEYIKENGFDDRVILIKNKKNIGGLANIYYAVHSCKNNDIIVTLDGDDWFANNHVLSHINQVYQDSNIWLTYGQYKYSSSGEIGPCSYYQSETISRNKFRERPFYASHLRTFYAGLFKKIKTEDLMYEGKFFAMTWDRAFMFPMVEMARDGHFKFISDVLYIYNNENPINDYKVDRKLQFELSKAIHKMKKYETIEHPYLSPTPKTNIKNIVQISIMKTGTHLLAKCIHSLTGCSGQWLTKLPHHADTFSTDLETFNYNRQNEKYWMTHLFFNKAFVPYLNNDKNAFFFIYRDPRDQIVSLAYHMKRKRAVYGELYRKAHKTPFPDLIMKLIMNGEICNSNPPYKNINELYRKYIPWLHDPNVCVLKFEDLVGPRGGGSLKAQCNSIKKIAKHLDISLTEKQIQAKANWLFGGTWSFRKGQIGSWKKHFNENHKIAFKEVAGQLLIDLEYEKSFDW